MTTMTTKAESALETETALSRHGAAHGSTSRRSRKAIWQTAAISWGINAADTDVANYGWVWRIICVAICYWMLRTAQEQ